MRMPWGKYEGQELSDIAESDNGYLLWVLEKADRAGPVLKSEIRRILGVGEPKTCSPPPPPPRVEYRTVYKLTAEQKQTISSGITRLFRMASKHCHPDRGGTNEDFQKLNGLYEILLKEIESN